MEGLLSSGLLRCFALAGKGNEPEERMGRNLRSHKALRCYQEDKTPPGYLWTPIPGFIQNTIPHPTVAYEGGMLRSVEHTTLSPGPMSHRRDHALVFCSHIKAPICRQALRGHCSRGRGEAGLVVMLPWWPEHVFTHVTLVGSVIISFASLYLKHLT